MILRWLPFFFFFLKIIVSFVHINFSLTLSCSSQRGTVIEKITEETLRDWSHLKELLSICEGKSF